MLWLSKDFPDMTVCWPVLCAVQEHQAPPMLMGFEQRLLAWSPSVLGQGTV